LAGVLAAVVVAITPSTGLRAVEILSPEGFTAHCVEKARAAVPRAVIEVEKPLYVTLTQFETGKSSILLADAYEAYKQSPGKLDEIAGFFVAGIRESSSAEVKLDASLIVPVVRDRAWLKEVVESDGSPVVFDELNEELIVVYAEDAPNSLSFFSPDELAKAQIDRGALRQLAADNLLRILPQIERRGADGLFQIQAGGDFEVSLLAIGTVWTKESFAVKGDFVFAAPAVGSLYITGSDDASGIRTLREKAAEIYRAAPQRLSPRLFVLRGGALSVLPD
jgi:uncharacterized protein YtpQ (UPF0354 family)